MHFKIACGINIARTFLCITIVLFFRRKGFTCNIILDGGKNLEFRKFWGVGKSNWLLI